MFTLKTISTQNEANDADLSCDVLTSVVDLHLINSGFLCFRLVDAREAGLRQSSHAFVGSSQSWQHCLRQLVSHIFKTLQS